MNIKEIAEIAKKLGIKPGKQRKASLIKSIQLAEGNFDCFGTAIDGECDQYQCKWRNDCLPSKHIKQVLLVEKKAPC